jgi:hypothetical protein
MHGSPGHLTCVTNTHQQYPPQLPPLPLPVPPAVPCPALTISASPTRRDFQRTMGPPYRFFCTCARRFVSSSSATISCRPA